MRQPPRPLDIAQLRRGRRIISAPQPGYFRVKMSRGGPWVPALIWLPCPWVDPIPQEATPAPEEWCRPHDRSRVLRGRIGFSDVEAAEVWERGSEITAKEYHWRLELARWARDHAPDQPEANPRKRAALEGLPSLY